MNWIERDQALHLDLRTPDFLTAFRVASALVDPAEKLNHHPDIAFGWGYVRITLTTHDAGGVTARDRQLAAALDEALDEALRPFGPLRPEAERDPEGGTLGAPSD